MSRAVLPLVAGIVVAALTGCGSIEIETDVDRFADGLVFPSEERAEAAERIPGYAGHLDEGCEIVVWMTHPQSHAAVRAARNHFSERQTGRARAEPDCRTIALRVRRAEHRWSDLDGWYRDVRSATSGAAPVVGIQVRRNRVALGYAGDGPGEEVQTHARRSGVPRGALLLGPVVAGAR